MDSYSVTSEDLCVKKKVRTYHMPPIKTLVTIFILFLCVSSDMFILSVLTPLKLEASNNISIMIQAISVVILFVIVDYITKKGYL